MLKNSLVRVMVIVAPLALLISACGVNMSGEPEIASERPIPPAPTRTPVVEEAGPGEESAAVGDVPAAPSAPSSIDLTGADFDLGFELYLQECAQCHGAQAGIGPSLAAMNDRAVGGAGGLAGVDYIHQSIVDPGAVVAEGYENIMPADYGERFSPQEIASLVTFIVDFSPEAMMAGPGGTGVADSEPAEVPEAAEATTAAGSADEAAAAGETLTVRGRLVQGTAGGETLSGGLPLELYALDMHGQLAGIYQTESDEDGSYVFEEVARGQGSIYLVQVRYQDVVQGAQIAAIRGDEEAITKDITVYERTTDPSNITITWAQMLINYAPIDQFGLEVWLMVELANTGDRIVTTEEIVGPNDWYVSAELELPVQAFGIQPMQTEGSNRFTVDVEDGVPVVKDTWPLRPGQVQTITLAYFLPYADGAVLDQAFNYPIIDGTVLVPNDTVELRSEQLNAGEWRYRVTEGGVRLSELPPGESVNPDRDFTLVSAHDLVAPLAADERLMFELVGRPTRTIGVMASVPPSDRDETDVLPLVLGAAGVLAIGLAGVLYWRQRAAPVAAGAAPKVVKPKRDDWQAPGPRADKQVLLRAIAELDDAYEAGELDEETYEERRNELVERLVPLMSDDR